MAKERRIKQARGGSSARKSRKARKTRVKSPSPVVPQKKQSVWWAFALAGLVLTAYFTWFAHAIRDSTPNQNRQPAASPQKSSQAALPTQRGPLGIPGVSAQPFHVADPVPQKGAISSRSQPAPPIPNAKLLYGDNPAFRTQTYVKDVLGNPWTIHEVLAPSNGRDAEILIEELRTSENGMDGKHVVYGHLVYRSIHWFSKETTRQTARWDDTTVSYYEDPEESALTKIVENLSGERAEVYRHGHLQWITETKPGTTEHSQVIVFGNDENGRPISSEDARPGQRSVYFDKVTGHVIATQDADGEITRFARYGSHHLNAGKVRLVLNTANQRQTYEYNSRGQLVSKWGDLGEPAIFVYSADGQPKARLSFAQHLGPIASNLLAMGDSPQLVLAKIENGPQVTTFIRDPATGKVLRKQYHDGTGIDYQYTSDGKLLSETNARGDKIHHEYAPATGDLVRTTQHPVDQPGKAVTKTFFRDRMGNLISVADSHLAPPTEGDKPGQDASAPQMSYERDLLGRVKVENLPGWRIERDYDAEGQLARVGLRDASGVEVHFVQYTWNPNRSLDSVESPSGVFAYRYLDNAPHLLQSVTGPVAETVFSYEPHRDLIVKIDNRFRKSGDEIPVLFTPTTPWGAGPM